MIQPSRRSFLVACSAAGVSIAVEQGMPRMLKAQTAERKIGIQLYTVAADLNTDVPKTLDALAKIGYKQVETAGFAKMSAKDFRKALDDAGLHVPSAHLHFTDADPSPLFEDAHAVGAHYAVSSVLIAPAPAVAGAPAAPTGMKGMMQALASLTLDDFKRTAELANKIGEKAKAAGLQFAYHNHNFEFKEQGGGKLGYDVLLDQTDADLVKFELDCGWMTAAGHDPIEYFKKYSGRYRMIHVKDFLPGPVTTSLAGPDRPEGTELGRGHIDYTKIFPAADKTGVEYFFSEQEPPIKGMTALEAAKVNYDYMRGIK